MSRRVNPPPSPLPQPSPRDNVKNLQQLFPKVTTNRGEIVRYMPPIDCIQEESFNLIKELDILKHCETPLSQTISDPLMNFITQNALDEFGPPCDIGEKMQYDGTMDNPDLEDSVKLTYENILRYSSLSMPHHRHGYK